MGGYRTGNLVINHPRLVLYLIPLTILSMLISAFRLVLSPEMAAQKFSHIVQKQKKECPQWIFFFKSEEISPRSFKADFSSVSLAKIVTHVHG